MNISLAITIGFTPEVQNFLSNLTMLANGANSNIEVPTNQTPVQTVPEVQPQVQQAPVSAVPTAPVVPQQQTMTQIPQQQYQQQPPVQQPPVQAVPTSAPAYDMNQLAVAATQLVDAGKRNELLSILAKFGVQALTDLNQDYYGAFATELRQLGAQI